MKNFDFTVAAEVLAITHAITFFTIIIYFCHGFWAGVGTFVAFIIPWVGTWFRHIQLRRTTLLLDAQSRSSEILALTNAYRDSVRVRGIISTSELCELLNNGISQKLFIGDITCLNNARSPYLRCAIKPGGECKGCSHYEKI